MSNFDSTKENLSEILKKIVEGKLQLPDFQRGWVWDDAHIKSLLVSIARSFPVGAVMLLETGGDVKFQVRPIENVELTKKDIEPEELILDGQQRLTSLTQVLKLDKPVKTFDEKGRVIKRHYYIDIEMALKLLTAVIRNDRFNEGALVRAFEDGSFPKIIQKLITI